MSEKNIVESVLDQLAPHRIQYLQDEVEPFVVVREGWQVSSLAYLLEEPLRINQSLTFADASGFIDYVNAFKTERTALFANPAHITAILDYHGKDSPSRCSHRAAYNLAHTVEWDTWANGQNREMSQEDFAWFLEEQVETIEEPKGGEILSLVREFKAVTTAKFASVLNDNGTTASFEFKKDTNAAVGAKQVEFPKQLTILLRPYDGLGKLDEAADAYRLTVRLKYRVRQDNSGVTFSYAIVGFERAKKAVFDAVVKAISEKVGTATFVGGALGR